MFEDYNNLIEKFKNGQLERVFPKWKRNSWGIRDCLLPPDNITKVRFNSTSYLERTKLKDFNLEPGMIFVIKDISIEAKIKTGLYKEFIVDKNYDNIILFREVEDEERRLTVSKIDILIDFVNLYIAK